MLDVVRTSRGRVVALITLFAVAGLVAAATDDGEVVTADDGVALRDHVATALRDHPRTPVLVPREMPEGYELSASPAPSTPGGGPGTTWVYRAVDAPAGSAAMSVCIVAATPDDAERTCTRGGSEAIARYEHGGVYAFVVPLGPGAEGLDDEVWRDLDLTARWESVDWLDG